MNAQIIIPVYHPDDKFIALIESLAAQTVRCPVLIIDSGAGGAWEGALGGLEAEVIRIPQAEFNHGGTRTMGIERTRGADVHVLLTQDAILASPTSIERLLAVFSDDSIGCAFGRQLPHAGASPFAAFAREFNYPATSRTVSMADSARYGMKTAFASNSFAAYRRTAMEEVGYFPTDTILSEDMCAVARLLMAGYRSAYVADATVYHSHNYSIPQEFRRYFDIGVFHAREPWIRDTFGNAEGEGGRFVQAEMRYLAAINPLLLAPMVLRDGMKFIGYRLGIAERKLPTGLKRKLSMTRGYWKT